MASNFEGIPDLTDKNVTENVDTAENGATSGSERVPENVDKDIKDTVSSQEPEDEASEQKKESSEPEKDFFGISKRDVAEVFLSQLMKVEMAGVGSKYDLLEGKFKDGTLRGVVLFKYLPEDYWEGFVNEVTSRLPESVDREEAKEKLKYFCLFKEDFDDFYSKFDTGEKRESDENLKQYLEEIRSRAFELFRLHGNQRKDLQAVSIALEEAEKFMEDQKRKMGDAFDGNRHREVELLELAIFDLKEDKKGLEIAGNLNEALRKDQKEFSKTVEENTRRIMILEKIERGENLTEAEKKERDEMGEITKQELVERRNSAMNSLAVAAGLYGARVALEGMEEDREDPLKSLERIRALEVAINMALSRIDIERKSMPEQQAQAVKKLEDAEAENTDYFTGVDGEEILRKDLKGEKDIDFFDKVTGEGQKQEVPAKGGNGISGEGEEYVEKVERSIESSSYQHLIDFFREKTSEAESIKEIASFLRIGRRELLADKIMALQEDSHVTLQKKIEPVMNGKGEVGTIVIMWEDAPAKWRKTTVKAFFEEYEDSGSLAPIRQALTSKEKTIGISVLEEDLGIVPSIQEETQDDSDINSENTDAITLNKEHIKNLLDDIRSGEVVDVEMTDGSHCEIARTEKGFVLTEEIISKGQLAGKNNSFILAKGAGTSFTYEGGTVYVGKISEITAIDGSGKEKEVPLKRDQIKPGDFIRIKDESDGMVYELNMDNKENITLRQLRETVVGEDESGVAVQGAEKGSALECIVSLLPMDKVKSVKKIDSVA